MGAQMLSVANRLAAAPAGQKKLILGFFLVLCVATGERQQNRLIPHEDDHHPHQHRCGFHFETNSKNASWESEYVTYINELKAMQAGSGQVLPLSIIQQDNKGSKEDALSPGFAIREDSEDPYDPCEKQPTGYSFYYEPFVPWSYPP